MITPFAPDVFPAGGPGPKFLDIVKRARFLGVQWCEFQLWNRFPLVKKIAPEWSGYSQAMAELKTVCSTFEELVQLHKDWPVSSSERGEDLIDLYLDKIESSEELLWQGENGHRRLMGALLDIPLGADGLYMALYSIMHLLAKHPEVQDKIVDELLRHSCGKFNSFLVKENLPFCKAVLVEAQRLVGQTGFGAPHLLKEDMVYKGFAIPKNVS